MENSPKSHKPLEIGDLRFLTIQERGGVPESNPTRKGRRRAAERPGKGRLAS